ncbi:protein of unknown function [Chitinophaga terrae (ex Kim and Jung 2007)]|uniref:DUF4954 family protein n=1 Tax=Chitinophaga terrae (ex Kim and Jung 2007) TaxID=408074 RepID=A0A1H4FVX4_9BACT|nr:DUF4954 family protein [Chitinophaga terrae (ex Kim and Jung 2007)]GEP92782.1 DUF4954 domain-containing protein [Chitinophaga terrae (ex Kim and Jung 2007)]SEB01476.1 protein of unknown function [Chitinophaga terrae (ex Kim and Jung 2007)]
MNKIQKKPLSSLGYNFIETPLPKGKDEYYLRNEQWSRKDQYRKLTAYEVEALVRNDNTSDDWNTIFVSEEFNPQLVQHCHFYGMVRIGKLEPYFLEFHNLRLPVGLYNSTICACDFGDNVVVHNVNYLSHYIIGNEVILANINEMATTDYAKFGNGIVKEAEQESGRIWLELCNENGGRRVMPFDGMLPGDAYLWTRNRDDEQLQQQFKSFTEKQFDKKRGYYGMVGDRCVIKNCKMIKDVTIGSDAYLKGANKLKNLTINSSAEASSQIGEGCEMVNGIVGYGCRVFYGVKAVRFVMASHSQLKYGARLINSYLGNNATISCCEVLNSLIFPAHEQHHNNSFLCAALIMGQSNMAAGATIGSNHNSRGADGEIIAARGFWPGLCVSLKHNSSFACFTLISKGTYTSELDISIPFSLVVNDEHENRLKIMPGYWFMYNMYAIARNSWKYVDRDKRTEKIQHIEYDYLAPDSVEEMFNGLAIMELATGEAWYRLEENAPKKTLTEKDIRKKGKELLLNHPDEVARLTILVKGMENSSREVQLLKVHKAYPLYRELIALYGIKNILAADKASFAALKEAVKSAKRGAWHNVGGQLMKAETLEQLKTRIKKNKISNWNQLHDAYIEIGEAYVDDKLQHAFASLLEIKEVNIKDFTGEQLASWLTDSVGTMQFLTEQIRRTREKDYKNPFRQMTYGNMKEMNAVIGSLEDNSFINQTATELEAYKQKVQKTIREWEL